VASAPSTLNISNEVAYTLLLDRSCFYGFANPRRHYAKVQFAAFAQTHRGASAMTATPSNADVKKAGLEAFWACRLLYRRALAPTVFAENGDRNDPKASVRPSSRWAMS
jgi:hypothetical protein